MRPTHAFANAVIFCILTFIFCPGQRFHLKRLARSIILWNKPDTFRETSVKERRRLDILDITALSDRAKLEYDASNRTLLVPDIPINFPKPKSVVIARLVGNSMPPLQGVLQSLHNIRYILENEDKDWLRDISTIEGCPPTIGTDPALDEGTELCLHEEVSVQRFWILNRIFNATERNTLRRLLEYNNELFWEIPLHLPQLKNSLDPLLYTTNQNNARNFGMQEAEALGADWILPFDGNIFVPRAGWLSLLRSLEEADMLGSMIDYSLVPMYRLRDDAITEDSVLSWDSTLETLAEMISRSEAQLMMRYNASVWFDHRLKYASKNKYKLLQQIERGRSQRVACKHADIGFNQVIDNITAEVALAEECGFSIRLPYWGSRVYSLSAVLVSDSSKRWLYRLSGLRALVQVIADIRGRDCWSEHTSMYTILIISHIFGLYIGAMAPRVIANPWIRAKSQDLAFRLLATFHSINDAYRRHREVVPHRE